jgi:prephenate dehydrogenase
MTNTVDHDWPRRVAILGVGLLGGSVALSLRRVRPQVSVVGLARSEAKGRRLQQLGIVDEIAASLRQAVDGCDVVVVATPVDRIADLVLESAAFCPEHGLITDVGSTKGGIVAALADHPVAVAKFVAAHPIAGSEKSGPQHASEDLFDGKCIVLTPDEQTDRRLLEKAERFWQLTGGITREMSPIEHDAHLAAISHVPHLVSALVAKMAHPDARPLVGSGWTDMTRIAAGDPTMWTAICRENRLAIRQELQRFCGELDHLRQLLDQQDDDALKRWLAEAQQVKQQSP